MNTESLSEKMEEENYYKERMSNLPYTSRAFRCKIDSHIPIEDGSACECGYFASSVNEDINRKDGFYN